MNINKINSIEKAVEISEVSLNIWKKSIHKSILEIDAKELLEDICKEQGSEKPSFPTQVLFGLNTLEPHGQSGNTKLNPGDLIIVDFGCTINGYKSDMSRTFVFDKASEIQKVYYDTVVENISFCESYLKVGVECSKIDKISRNYFKNCGYKKYIKHSVGHGVGKRIHQSPWLSSISKNVFKSGDVFTIEPGLYIPKVGGIRIENMYKIVNKEITCLMKSNFTNLEEIN